MKKHFHYNIIVAVCVHRLININHPVDPGTKLASSKKGSRRPLSLVKTHTPPLAKYTRDLGVQQYHTQPVCQDEFRRNFSISSRSYLLVGGWSVFFCLYLYYCRSTRPGVRVGDEFEVHREQAYEIRARHHDDGIMYVCSVARSF